MKGIEMGDIGAKHYWNYLVGLFFPTRCICCDKSLQLGDKESLCSFCLAKILEDPAISRCPICQGALLEGVRCFSCEGQGVQGRRHYFLFYNQDEGKTLLSRVKFDRHREVFSVLADMLRASGLKRAIGGYDVAVLVPNSSRSSKTRGYSMVGEIGKLLSRYAGIKCYSFIRKISSREQHRLGARERRLNAKESFDLKKSAVRRLLRFRKVLLVDDIYTTGSTMGQCEKLLTEVNSSLKVDYFYLAKTPYNIDKRLGEVKKRNFNVSENEKENKIHKG